MELAHPAKHVPPESISAARPGCRCGASSAESALKRTFGKRKLAREVLEHALAVEEVEGSRRLIPASVAARRRPKRRRASGAPWASSCPHGRRTRAHFVELNVLHAAGLIVRDGAQKAGMMLWRMTDCSAFIGFISSTASPRPSTACAALEVVAGSANEYVMVSLMPHARRVSLTLYPHVLRRAHAEAAATAGKRGGSGPCRRGAALLRTGRFRAEGRGGTWA